MFLCFVWLVRKLFMCISQPFVAGSRVCTEWLICTVCSVRCVACILHLPGKPAPQPHNRSSSWWRCVLHLSWATLSAPAAICRIVSVSGLLHLLSGQRSSPGGAGGHSLNSICFFADPVQLGNAALLEGDPVQHRHRDIHGVVCGLWAAVPLPRDHSLPRLC